MRGKNLRSEALDASQGETRWEQTSEERRKIVLETANMARSAALAVLLFGSLCLVAGLVRADDAVVRVHKCNGRFYALLFLHLRAVWCQ